MIYIHYGIQKKLSLEHCHDWQTGTVEICTDLVLGRVLCPRPGLSSLGNETTESDPIIETHIMPQTFHLPISPHLGVHTSCRQPLPASGRGPHAGHELPGSITRAERRSKTKRSI